MNRRKKRQVLKKINIVDVVKNFVKLQKTSSNLKGLSPFVKEKIPSFFVSPSKQIFKCFASGKGGNVIEFLQSFSWKCENPDCESNQNKCFGENPDCGYETHSLTEHEAIYMLLNDENYNKFLIPSDNRAFYYEDKILKNDARRI